jgi:hypothetical protein
MKLEVKLADSEHIGGIIKSRDLSRSGRTGAVVYERVVHGDLASSVADGANQISG